MRIWPDHMRMNEARTLPGPAIRNRAGESRIRCNWIGAIDFFKMEIWKARNQPRNVSSRSLHLDRNRDRVSVVLHHEQHRQLAVGSGVHRLPEFALAAGAVSERNVGHFVAVKGYIFELPVIPFTLFRCLWMICKIAASLRTTHGLQNLRSSGRRLRDHIQLRKT